MAELREYQRHAVDAIYNYFNSGAPGNPLIVAPTGSGKSHIIAHFMQEVLTSWPNQRLLMLAHRKELLLQNTEKLIKLWPEAPIGLYSAGLGKKQLGRKITIAGIQSVYRKSKQLGWNSLVLVDEAHLIPHRSDGMYLSLLKGLQEINPKIRVIGFTATPYRLKGGLLIEDHSFFTDIAYDIHLSDLIEQGFLAPLISKSPVSQADLSDVRVRGGEFVAADAEAAMDQERLITAALNEVDTLAKDRTSFLIFCAGVDHAAHVLDALKKKGKAADIVIGDTPKKERADILEKFKRGQITHLVNVDVLTTGFDAPNVDCLIILRPTKSVGLYVQMVGRGSRLAPNKENCLVLDFAGNIERHGPVDKVRVSKRAKKGGGEESVIETAPVKTCPECLSPVIISARECPDCGYEFPPPKPKHDIRASDAPILSTQQEPQNYSVLETDYFLHEKPGKPNSMRVEYTISKLNGMRLEKISEWICFEHEGYAGKRAAEWWRLHDRLQIDPQKRRMIQVPRTTAEALRRITELRKVSHIVTRREGKYNRILSYVFINPEDELPDWLENFGNDKQIEDADIF